MDARQTGQYNQTFNDRQGQFESIRSFKTGNNMSNDRDVMGPLGTGGGRERGRSRADRLADFMATPSGASERGPGIVQTGPKGRPSQPGVPRQTSASNAGDFLTFTPGELLAVSMAGAASRPAGGAGGTASSTAGGVTRGASSQAGGGPFSALSSRGLAGGGWWCG